MGDIPALTWTKECTKRLIMFVEGLPQLWNTSCPEFKDRDKRQAALETLAEEFQTSTTEVSRKIHNLRTQLNNELRKLRKKKRVKNKEDGQISSWEYFESLTFMLPPNKLNKTLESLEAEENENEKEPQSPIRKRIKSHDDVVKQALTIINQPDDDASIFGAFVASSLRNLKRDRSRKKMKRQIQQVILEIEEQEDLEEEFVFYTKCEDD